MVTSLLDSLLSMDALAIDRDIPRVMFVEMKIVDGHFGNRTGWLPFGTTKAQHSRIDLARHRYRQTQRVLTVELRLLSRHSPCNVETIWFGVHFLNSTWT